MDVILNHFNQSAQNRTQQKNNDMKTKVNKENQTGKNEFFHVTLLDSRKQPLRCRRNGATKLWKTRPEEFKIPVKYGMYEYFYITQDNAHEWTISLF